MSGPRPERQWPGGLARFAGPGVELAATVLGACLLGWWINHHFGTPWGLPACAVVGIVGGLYNMVRPALRELARTAERERQERRRKKDDAGKS